MKLSTITILLLLNQTIFANDIDAKIAQIKSATESQRYILVNELKKQIAQMNALEQARAVTRYQEESLKAQQTANIANDIHTINQIHQQQDQQIIVPVVDKPIKPLNIPGGNKIPTPVTKPNNTPQPTIPNPAQPIIKPNTQPSTPQIQTPIKPVVQPTYTPPTPTFTQPKPTYTPPKPTFTQPKPTYTPPKPTYTQPSKPVQPKPTYTQPSKPVQPKPTYTPAPSKPSGGKSSPSSGRF